MEKEIRDIQSFDKIRFKDFGNLILTQGDQESLTHRSRPRIDRRSDLRSPG